jgi:hypothetical protein
MGHDNRANLQDLIQGLLTGRLMEVFEKYYAEDVVMSENALEAETRVGKEKNRGYEAYFAANAQWHDAKVGPLIVDGDHSAYEMYMDFTFLGQRMQRTQVAVQEWRDGQIVKETFYYKP